MTGADPIPAIREEDAEGETASLFADLRTRLDVPFVNLIWRHLATIPGALAWTWGLVRPLYGTQALASASADLRGMVGLDGLEPVPAHVWEAAGVTQPDRAVIGDLVADYNHANGVNFLAMLVAASVLKGEAQAAGRAAEPGSPPAARPASEPAPRLLALGELSPPLLALVKDLDGFGRLGENEAVASLYRHLAHWPPYLALARTALWPLHRAGTLAREQQKVIAAGRRHAASLAALAAPAPPLDPASAARALAAIDAFTRLMIGRMIVMGAAMEALLGRDGPPRD